MFIRLPAGSRRIVGTLQLEGERFPPRSPNTLQAQNSKPDRPVLGLRLIQSGLSDPSPENDQRLTIQRAIQQYLQAHRTVGHRPKTLEWHQIALGHVQEYMLKECHLHLVHQITEETMKNWLTFVAQTPTKEEHRVRRAPLRPMHARHEHFSVGSSSEERSRAPPCPNTPSLGALFLSLTSCQQPPLSR